MNIFESTPSLLQLQSVVESYRAIPNIASFLDQAHDNYSAAQAGYNGVSVTKSDDQFRLEQRINQIRLATMGAKHSKLEEQATEAESKIQKQPTSVAHMEALLSELSAKKTERGVVITLENVLFGTDLAPLNPSGMRIVQKLVYVLQQNLKYIVLVEGFTDNTGSASHNQDLSERRAISVRNALLELGVARERITIRGYGEAYPIADNDTAVSRQFNRRVEIVLSEVGDKLASRKYLRIQNI